jgi:hypothetical protein
MPVMYYTEEEYVTLKGENATAINLLITEIKALKGETCNMVLMQRVMSCGECKFNGWKSDQPKCTSQYKYFCK